MPRAPQVLERDVPTHSLAPVLSAIEAAERNVRAYIASKVAHSRTASGAHGRHAPRARATRPRDTARSLTPRAAAGHCSNRRAVLLDGLYLPVRRPLVPRHRAKRVAL